MRAALTLRAARGQEDKTTVRARAHARRPARASRFSCLSESGRLVRLGDKLAALFLRICTIASWRGRTRLDSLRCIVSTLLTLAKPTIRDGLFDTDYNASILAHQHKWPC